MNVFRAGSSTEKLRGKYYTPAALVRLILEQVAPQPGDALVDPSCGDGEFLVGAVHYLVDAGVRETDTLLRAVTGLDVSEEAVQSARLRVAAVIEERLGVAISPEQVNVRCANALELAPEEVPAGDGDGRLVVVGNPPYVEAKRLSREQKLALKQRFPLAASGAPDLYLYFLHACLGWLRPADRLALVLPNRVLVNANARDLREQLLQGEQLLGIDFATRTGIFPDAAVYPVVLYAGGSAPDEQVVLAGIEQSGAGLCRQPLSPLPRSRYGTTKARALFPTPADPRLARALERLVRQVPEGRLADLLDIRWSVSFHRRGLREQFVRRTPEGMLHPERFLGGGTFAGNGEVTRYRTEWGGWWIDFDAERLRAEGNALPPLELFRTPRVVICQNGRSLRAAFDESGYVLKDTLLCGLLRAGEHPLLAHPRAVVGLLCSRAVHFYFSHVFHGGHVNGGYLHFLRSFLEDVPTGQWSDASAAEVAELVRQREALPPSPEAAELEEQIEALVSAGLGLTPQEQSWIREWGENDENWTLRDRVRKPRISQHPTPNTQDEPLEPLPEPPPDPAGTAARE